RCRQRHGNQMTNDDQCHRSSLLCILRRDGPVQSGFLHPKRATVDLNRSTTDPDIAGTEPDHLGPVFCGPRNQKRSVQPVFWCKFCCTNKNHFYLNYHYSEN
ncbi:hypothetical protein K443DRAFT_91612, partial [Laccaria amethystina LaAM-08-1]